MEGISCSGFTFYNNFDSANLAKVEYVAPNESVISLTNNSTKAPPELPDAEFNIWTTPDCCGTEFENGNRTWFYFGVKAPSPALLVRLNIVDLNRQGRMYSQGMAPVFRTVPGKIQWERISDRPIYNTVDDIFTLSFKFKSPENVQSISYFAFTYPFSYTDLQKMLTTIETRFSNYTATFEDDIYYSKELVCRSLGGRDIHLLTISSYHGITPELETRLKNLFPDKNHKRPFKFIGKKVIFMSARVHPGETPSSFVFNGILNLLLNRDDPVAIALRRLYVFKMIPFLNPDGVAMGHYRTDTRGVNLNRVYLNPNLLQHPPVYAARALIRYYHYGFEKDENEIIQGENISTKVSHMSLEENKTNWCMKCKSLTINLETDLSETNFYTGTLCRRCKSTENVTEKGDVNCNESGLFLYIDLHGHASKKGIFMYGNHFEDFERNVECMLLPKLMSMNNHNFHFTACNFTERNMYLRDRRDGMSREGSGRVAVLKLTGLIKSYTLECNYNTGRLVNVLPPAIRDCHNNKLHTILVPPKYNPQVFEEVGKSLGASILDLTGQNPCSRLPNSEFHSIGGLKDWLRINCAKNVGENRNKKMNPHSQVKSGLVMKRPAPKRVINKTRPNTVPIEKKESTTKPGCSFTATESAKMRFNKTLVKSKKDLTVKFKRSTSSEKKRSKLKKDEEKFKRGEGSWKPTSSQVFAKVEAGSSSYLSFSKTSLQKSKLKKNVLRRLEGVKMEKVKKRKKLKSK